ncbi:MAG: serine hydrolase [Lachnospiraceae bacterium]|nr:serine hydrolase [Lachnospiraceae bacterium]
MKCTNNSTTNGSERSCYTEREWARINAKETEEKKKQKNLFFIMGLLLLIVLLMLYMVYYFVLRSHDYELSHTFQKTDTVFGIQNGVQLSDTAEAFASDLCVTSGNVNDGAIALKASEGALFNLEDNRVDYAKDIFTSRSPASLTKVMTALVALKYGNLDDIVTVTDTALDIEYDSSVCDIKVGDQISLKQLLYGLLIASGNDAAMMIAEHVGGSVDNFVTMMNEEAKMLGATNSHFANPHGLTESEHYTSAYDLYLIFNAAMQYDTFMDIINRTNYYAEYTRGDGSPVAVTWETTNHYFTGEAKSPDNVIVYGGKTGTTDDAGACLTLLTKDLYGTPYLSVIMNASTKEDLYAEMNQILSMIEN